MILLDGAFISSLCRGKLGAVDNHNLEQSVKVQRARSCTHLPPLNGSFCGISHVAMNPLEKLFGVVQAWLVAGVEEKKTKSMSK